MALACRYTVIIVVPSKKKNKQVFISYYYFEISQGIVTVLNRKFRDNSAFSKMCKAFLNTNSERIILLM